MTTSQYHPLAELRSRVIRPFSDMLLQDMGPGLADNLGEREAAGAEWRTTPLWEDASFDFVLCDAHARAQVKAADGARLVVARNSQGAGAVSPTSFGTFPFLPTNLQRSSMKPFNAWIACSLCAALAATAGPAAAQTPEGVMKQDAATSGSTEVGGAGFQTVEKPADTKEATELKFSGGGMMVTGNARSLALTGSGNMRLRRAANEYSASLAANYGRAAASPADPVETTVENVQGRIRYDRFLSEKWSLFAAQSLRKDRFQGLDLRLNFDPGVAYYVFDVEKHRFWGELGYDLQYDIRDQELIDASSEPIDKTEVRHSARAFLGYQNDLNEAVRFNTGLEYIQAIVDTENWRLNWDMALTSSISTNFSLATTFSLRYDHNPLPGIENTDTTTAVSLVYTLL